MGLYGDGLLSDPKPEIFLPFSACRFCDLGERGDLPI